MRFLLIALASLAMPGLAAPQAMDGSVGDPEEIIETETDREARPAAGNAAEHRAATANTATAATQPTVGNFLYQVLLGVVTALITALLWRAIF